MSQLNIHLTPNFEKTLLRFMRLRQVKTKSEAVRLAVQEALAKQEEISRKTNYADWVGVAKKLPLNPSPKFSSDETLW